MNPYSELLTVSEVARILGVAEQTARSYDSRGLLPALRLVNGVRVWLRKDVEQLARQRERLTPEKSLKHFPEGLE